MLEVLFSNPGYLAAGGALVSSPIIIHLINRMRFKRLRWAAMEFLLKSQKRNRRRLIIEQILLLMLRCLLVLLATLLVSRLDMSFAMGQTKDVLHILLLDDSLSMSDRWKEGDGYKNCYSQAEKVLNELVKKARLSRTAERLALLRLSPIVMDRSYRPEIFGKLNETSTILALRKELDIDKNILRYMEGKNEKVRTLSMPDDLIPEYGMEALPRTKMHLDLLPGLKKAAEIARANGESQVFIYVISDFRQQDWGEGRGEGLQKTLLGLVKEHKDLKVRLIDTVIPDRPAGAGGMPIANDNVGIVDVRAGTRLVGKGMPVTFTVTLANFGTRDADVNLAVYDDATGQEMLQVDFDRPLPVKIRAGALDEKVSFELRFNPTLRANESYFAQLSVHLETPQRGPLENDGLIEDNLRHVAIEVRNKVPILVVDGEGPRGREENQDSFFIKNAISSVPGGSYEVVFGDEISGGNPARVLERPDLRQYPAIFLLNVRDLKPKQKENLERYLQDGGGAAFFLGPRVSPDYYNKELYKKGQGLFPVPLDVNYFPPENEEPRKPEIGLPQLLLRFQSQADLKKLPIFGPIFRDTGSFEILNDLPIRRYFKVPRSQWRTEKEKVEELATLPNEKAITSFQEVALGIFKKLDDIVQKDKKYWNYLPGLQRHMKTVKELVSPGSEKKAFHLALALQNMLLDKGKEKQAKEYPNLTEFWAEVGDPKIGTLKKEITDLIEQVRYGDPLVVVGQYGKGKVAAVMTTAGKEWNDWAGGSEATLIYMPFIWEMQNYLSSQGSESSQMVGSPVQIVVDAEPFKQKNRLLKMVRFFQKAKQGRAVQEVLDSEQFGERKGGQETFNFSRNLEPGLYIAKLIFADQAAGQPPLATWGHVFNVDTMNEGRLLRVSNDDMGKSLVRPSEGKIKLESAQAVADEAAAARKGDVAEFPWFYLIFIFVLIAEQALAVHLSFHLRSAEGDIPATAPRVSARAA